MLLDILSLQPNDRVEKRLQTYAVFFGQLNLLDEVPIDFQRAGQADVLAAGDVGDRKAFLACADAECKQEVRLSAPIGCQHQLEVSASPAESFPTPIPSEVLDRKTIDPGNRFRPYSSARTCAATDSSVGDLPSDPNRPQSWTASLSFIATSRCRVHSPRSLPRP